MARLRTLLHPNLDVFRRSLNQRLVIANQRVNTSLNTCMRRMEMYSWVSQRSYYRLPMQLRMKQKST